MSVMTQAATPQLTTRSGFQLWVRAGCPADELAVADFFDAVSADDLRFRFLTAVEHVGHARLQSMLDVDHVRTETFLASDATGTIVAVAMLACDSQLEVGEVAISMRSDLKGNGIGWTLLDYVAGEARRRGVKRLQSVESRDNHSAVELEREMGFRVVPGDDDPSVVILETKF